MFYTLSYPFFYLLFRVTTSILGRLKVTGQEKVPKTGALIYCPNHLSDADPATVMVSLPRRAWFIGKRELFELPIWGWIFRHFHAIPIRRDSPDRSALRRAEEILKSGSPLLIFPEGYCAIDGRLQRILPGAAMLSLRTGAPIVPVGVCNTNKMLPYGSTRLRRSSQQVTVAFGDPISPLQFAEMPRSAAIAAITSRLGQSLAELTGQEVPELNTALPLSEAEPAPASA